MTCALEELESNRLANTQRKIHKVSKKDIKIITMTTNIY